MLPHPTLPLSTPELRRFLQERRSVRRFLPVAVPADVLDRVLEGATWAPSAHNRQPWRLVVLSSPASRLALVEALSSDFRRDLLADNWTPEKVEVQVERSRRRILEAPAAILVCLDPSAEDLYPDERRQSAERLMSIQSVAMAGENLLLAAHAEGLGGVWMCAPLFAPAAAQQALILPQSWEPHGLILLGYPLQTPPARPRRPMAEIVLFK